MLIMRVLLRKSIDIDNLLIDCDYFIYVPNVFSPNADGNNDMLYVRGNRIESLRFNIYNRWGNKVFETDNVRQGWDGKYRGKD